MFKWMIGGILVCEDDGSFENCALYHSIERGGWRLTGNSSVRVIRQDKGSKGVTSE
jgi:hypothetical protein